MKKTLAGLICLFPIFLFSVETALPAQASNEIIEVGRFFNALGLCSATAGNFSVRLGEDLFAITVSGKHKGDLTLDDVILINSEGSPQNTNKKASAETSLHTLIYRLYPHVGAVLHTHSVNGTVLSRIVAPLSSLVTEGYEIHKVFPGIKTHESRLELPIFENTQDYLALSEQVSEYLASHPQTFGFFLRGHGLYTWGKDITEAKIRTEAFEFLFESELKIHMCK